MNHLKTFKFQTNILSQKRQMYKTEGYIRWFCGSIKWGK